MNHGLRVELIGDGGMIQLVKDINQAQIWTPDEREQWRDFGALSQRSMPTNYPVRSPFLNALDDMIHCIETGAEPRSSGRDGMRAFEMITAIHLSHRAGKRPIEFPLVERDFEIPSN